MNAFGMIRKEIMDVLEYAVIPLSSTDKARARLALRNMDDQTLGKLYDRNKLTESFWKKELLK